MIIPDVELKKLVEQGYLPEGLNIGPSSVDLTLADSFSWPAEGICQGQVNTGRTNIQTLWKIPLFDQFLQFNIWNDHLDSINSVLALKSHEKNLNATNE